MGARCTHSHPAIGGVIMKKICIVAILLSVLMLFGCGESSDASAAVAQSESAAEQEIVVQELIADDIIEASFVKVFEEDSVQGACYLQLNVINKFDREITVMITDVYLNGTQAFGGSGVPMTIAVGKNSQNPFFISYSNTNITELEQVETIEFKLMITGDDNNTIETTASILIEI